MLSCLTHQKEQCNPVELSDCTLSYREYKTIATNRLSRLLLFSESICAEMSLTSSLTSGSNRSWKSLLDDSILATFNVVWTLKTNNLTARIAYCHSSSLPHGDQSHFRRLVPGSGSSRNLCYHPDQKCIPKLQTLTNASYTRLYYQAELGIRLCIKTNCSQAFLLIPNTLYPLHIQHPRRPSAISTRSCLQLQLSSQESLSLIASSCFPKSSPELWNTIRQQ